MAVTGEAALVEEVERERCWMKGIWAAVTVSDEIAARAEPTAVSAWLVYTRTRASMPRLRSDIRAGSFDLSREEYLITIVIFICSSQYSVTVH